MIELYTRPDRLSIGGYTTLIFNKRTGAYITLDHTKEGDVERAACSGRVKRSLHGALLPAQLGTDASVILRVSTGTDKEFERLLEAYNDADNERYILQERMHSSKNKRLAARLRDVEEKAHAAAKCIETILKPGLAKPGLRPFRTPEKLGTTLRLE
jgi:hypothetical protein